MNLYDFLVSVYNNFVSLFPGPIQWLVTLLILIGLLGAIYRLVRHNVIFIIIVIILLPFLIPVLARLFHDLYQFILYLLQVLKLTSPRS